MFVPFILGAKLATIGVTTITAAPVAAAAVAPVAATIGATAAVATATVAGVKVTTVLKYSAVAVGSAGLAYGAHKMMRGDPTEDQVVAENRPPPL